MHCEGNSQNVSGSTNLYFKWYEFGPNFTLNGPNYVRNVLELRSYFFKYFVGALHSAMRYSTIKYSQEPNIIRLLIRLKGTELNK